MRRRGWTFLAVTVVCGVFVPQEALLAEQVEFEAGQRWAYETRPEDPDSTIVIGKVEESEELGEIIHISVFDVNVKSPRAPGGLTHAVHHMPISADALRASVTRQVGTGAPAAQFGEGYRIWREAVEDGGAGIFSIQVREAVAHFESIINGSE